MEKEIFRVEFPLSEEIKMQILVDEKRDLSMIVSSYLAWNPEVYFEIIKELKKNETPKEKEEDYLDNILELMNQKIGRSVSLSEREDLRELIIMTFNYRINDKEIYRHYLLKNEELLANAYAHEARTIRFTYEDYHNSVINETIEELEETISATGWLIKVHRVHSSGVKVNTVDLFEGVSHIPLKSIMNTIMLPQKEGQPKLEISLSYTKSRLVLRRGQEPSDDIYELIALDENKNPKKINL